MLALEILATQVAFVLLLALARGPGRRLLKRISDPTLPGFPSVNDEGWGYGDGHGNVVYKVGDKELYTLVLCSYGLGYRAFAGDVEVNRGHHAYRMAKAVAMAIARRQHAQLAYEAARKELEDGQ